VIQSPVAPWAVELVDFRKTFRPHWSGRPVVAVSGVTLRLAAGQVLGLLGPNGSGKSTTLKAMAGLARPTAGICRVHAQPAEAAAARGLIGYLPESARFAPHQTSREFLTYCAGLSGVDSDRMEAMLAWSGLGEAADQRMAGYSKGMMQRIGLAQAVLANPPVVLLDEPVSGLDPAGRLALANLICDLRARGTTVVFSAHLLDQAVESCDLIAILGEGRLLAFGTPEELVGAQPPSVVRPSRLEQLYLEKTGANV
jgi:ABC-type multidrug transport system ATPase subunit